MACPAQMVPAWWSRGPAGSSPQAGQLPPVRQTTEYPCVVSGIVYRALSWDF